MTSKLDEIEARWRAVEERKSDILREVRIQRHAEEDIAHLARRQRKAEALLLEAVQRCADDEGTDLWARIKAYLESEAA